MSKAGAYTSLKLWNSFLLSGRSGAGGILLGVLTLSCFVISNPDQPLRAASPVPGSSLRSASPASLTEEARLAADLAALLINGPLRVEGQRRQWHKVTLTLEGPSARETDSDPNPFVDYRFEVAFRPENGDAKFVVPGYFAADGQAAETSAKEGNRWRAHFAPDQPGTWRYVITFRKGKLSALDAQAESSPLPGLDGLAGSFEVGPTDKQAPDLRARGRLEYVGRHHLRFAGTGEFFLKAGADAPENLLGYEDFDDTSSGKRRAGVVREGEAVPSALHRYQPHLRDWKAGDPSWKNGKGKGLIGALNYLAGKGCNAYSFLTYNASGDGDDVWPFASRDDKFHYDCSKLDQWRIVFDHAQTLGLFHHFKMQETELDDNRRPKGEEGKPVPAALDQGDLGPERKLYCRELIARFGYLLALNWNLGEENTQSSQQQRDMARYLHETDPYHHPIVLHTFPGAQERIYTPLLGDGSLLSGVSLQNGWNQTHKLTVDWVQKSSKAGRPWVVANDEQGPADMGVPPDPGYQGHSGQATMKDKTYTLDDIRKATLWGNLTAGGAGVEYYFGYKLPQNDLNCEDFRSRDRSWDYCRIALDFFRDQKIPFWDMKNADELVGNPSHDNSRFCLAKPGSLYLVYLPEGGQANLDLSAAEGSYRLQWYNPRSGGPLQDGSVTTLSAGRNVSLGLPPKDHDADWVALLRK